MHAEQLNSIVNLVDIINLCDNNQIKYLCCEMGYDQKKSLLQILTTMNTNKIEFYKDLENFDRGFCVEYNTDKKEKNV